MLSCKEITEKADDYLDRNLPLATRMSFRMHLFLCNRCSRYLDQLKVTIGVLNGLEENAPCSDEQARRTVDAVKSQLQTPEK